MTISPADVGADDRCGRGSTALRRRKAGTLRISLLVLFAAAPAAQDREPIAAPQFAPVPPAFAFVQQPPKGLRPMPLPADYAPTAAMFELGRALFHDGILSRDGSVSCASCHREANGFAHPDAAPPGIAGQRAARHTPVLWNRGYASAQRWDGASPSLEAFVLEPIADAREMGSSVADALARLAADAKWRDRFAAAFGRPADAEALQRSLATFVRGIVAGDAPYDRFLAGDAAAMSAEQRHGQWLFESKAACWKCHVPPLFTDESFHATGIGLVAGAAEPARAAVTGDAADRGKWKTPTLRGLRLSAPYMHDGSLPTLDDVIAFYARGGNAHPQLDPRMRPLDLSAAEQRALVAFLQSL